MKNKMADEFIENCRYLGLNNLPANYQTSIDKANKANIGFMEFICGIVQQEADDRRERVIKYRLKNSKLPQPYKLLEDFDFPFQPKLSKKLIMDLATMEFIKRKESILLIGYCGTGNVNYTIM